MVSHTNGGCRECKDSSCHGRFSAVSTQNVLMHDGGHILVQDGFRSCWSSKRLPRMIAAFRPMSTAALTPLLFRTSGRREHCELARWLKRVSTEGECATLSVCRSIDEHAVELVG